MAVKAKEQETGDLFGEASKEKKEHIRSTDACQKFYPIMLREPGPVVTAYTLTARLFDEEVWEMLPQREANIMLKVPQARAWMEEIKPNGRRGAYKTEERGRLPFEECTKEELISDILRKCDQEGALWHNIRIDIMNLKAAYPGVKVVGSNGEAVPERIWSGWDEKGWEMTMGLVKKQADAAD